MRDMNAACLIVSSLTGEPISIFMGYSSCQFRHTLTVTMSISTVTADFMLVIVETNVQKCHDYLYCPYIFVLQMHVIASPTSASKVRQYINDGPLVCGCRTKVLSLVRPVRFETWILTTMPKSAKKRKDKAADFSVSHLLQNV